MRAKPFLKWAGGKTQLLEQIKEQIPISVTKNKFTYIEPFVGSGALLFWMFDEHPNIENAIINDINLDLTNTYLSIKNDVKSLIEILKKMEIEYHNVYLDKEQAKVYYYKKRELFNTRSTDILTQSALFIF